MNKQGQRINVAVADDHTMFRKGVISLLNESSRFKIVAEAGNGQALADAIERLPAPPDVCLLDINMPELNGYETLQLLKQKYPGMKFLILTMLDHEMIILKMLHLGANGYILKEEEPSELKRAIETVYEKQYYHSEHLGGHLISLVTRGVEYDKFQLSDQELKFLGHTCSELSYKEIAVSMNLSPRTVESYRDQLFEKLDVRSRTGLAIYALRLGLASIDQ